MPNQPKAASLTESSLRAALSPMKVRMLTFMAVMFFCILLFPGEAHARRKRGLAIINYGQNITSIQEPSIGYVHSRFGVLWIFDIWSWDGEYCTYDEDSYTLLTREQAAEILDVPVAEVNPPASYRYPLGLVVLIVLAVGITIKSLIRTNSIRRRHQANERDQPSQFLQGKSSSADTADDGRPGLFASTPAPNNDFDADEFFDEPVAEVEDLNALTQDAFAHAQREYKRLGVEGKQSPASNAGQMSRTDRRNAAFHEGVDWLTQQGMDRTEAKVRLKAVFQEQAGK